MTHQRGQTEYYSDTMMAQIGRLMVNYGNNQMINHFQREMSRYSGAMKQQNVDDNGNVEAENYNSNVSSASRKRVREETIFDVDHQKKVQKSRKRET